MSEQKTFHFPDATFVSPQLQIKIPMGATNKALQTAQYWLDNRIMTDMLPYMPFNTGMFRENTQAISRSLAGTGLVCAAAPPMGRYLYYGKVMVDSATGRGAIPIEKNGEIIFRFRRGAVLMPTSRYLDYSYKYATAMWFEEAQRSHEQQWIAGVQKILGGGI